MRRDYSMSFSQRFTQVFFWCGFAVFMVASIPHLGAFFRHFDPNTSNPAANGFYWVIAFLLAIVIDVSDVLVSIAVLKAVANGARVRDVLAYWLFIVFIVLFSWGVNWQYNVVFETSTFAAADKIVLFGTVSLGTINPLVGSAFQVLLLVYTGMAHKFSERPQTAEQLALEADRLEALEEHQQRIDAYRERNKKPGLIRTIRRAKNELFSKDSEQPQLALDTPVEVLEESESEHLDVRETQPFSTSVEPLEETERTPCEVNSEQGPDTDERAKPPVRITQ